MKKFLVPAIQLILFVFAMLTLYLSASILMDWFGVRAEQGNYVPLVVQTNLACSLLYLLALGGWLGNQKWAVSVLALAVVLLFAAGIGLAVHIQSGGVYETKTIGALAFRAVITVFFTITAYVSIKPGESLKQ